MAITKKALAEKIKRRFGYPMIKVELDNSQIYDAIDYARQKFIKWAVGQATTETFFTVMLSAGENMYDLPVGVVDVIDYGEPGFSSGINTLFTLDNYLYSQGMYDALRPGSGGDYSLISYHMARDFLDVVRKYTPMKYNYKYHRYTNTLEIHPAAAGGTWLTLDEGEFESPGFLLLRSYMIEGSTHISGWENGDSSEDFYDLDWIFDYATAECKVILGMIRRKFENFVSIGNTGVSLDGGDLISEGKEEKERLEETLRLEENFDGGYDISIGY